MLKLGFIKNTHKKVKLKQRKNKEREREKKTLQKEEEEMRCCQKQLKVIETMCSYDTAVISSYLIHRPGGSRAGSEKF